MPPRGLIALPFLKNVSSTLAALHPVHRLRLVGASNAVN